MHLAALHQHVQVLLVRCTAGGAAYAWVRLGKLQEAAATPAFFLFSSALPSRYYLPWVFFLVLGCLGPETVPTQLLASPSSRWSGCSCAFLLFLLHRLLPRPPAFPRGGGRDIRSSMVMMMIMIMMVL